MLVYTSCVYTYIQLEVKYLDTKEKIVVEGTVTDAFPGGKFNVELENGHTILAYLSGKMRKYYIRIVLGDRVKVEISPYDLERGRITYRYRSRDRIQANS